jgi:hypothetical protein
MMMGIMEVEATTVGDVVTLTQVVIIIITTAVRVCITNTAPLATE